MGYRIQAPAAFRSGSRGFGVGVTHHVCSPPWYLQSSFARAYFVRLRFDHDSSFDSRYLGNRTMSGTKYLVLFYCSCDQVLVFDETKSDVWYQQEPFDLCRIFVSTSYLSPYLGSFHASFARAPHRLQESLQKKEWQSILRRL